MGVCQNNNFCSRHQNNFKNSCELDPNKVINVQYFLYRFSFSTILIQTKIGWLHGSKIIT